MLKKLIWRKEKKCQCDKTMERLLRLWCVVVGYSTRRLHIHIYTYMCICICRERESCNSCCNHGAVDVDSMIKSQTFGIFFMCLTSKYMCYLSPPIYLPGYFGLCRRFFWKKKKRIRMKWDCIWIKWFGDWFQIYNNKSIQFIWIW